MVYFTKSMPETFRINTGSEKRTESVNKKKEARICVWFFDVKRMTQNGNINDTFGFDGVG